MRTSLLGVLLALVLALPQDPARAEGRRVALVIGNVAYENLAPLSNPGNDAARLAEILARNGFEVMDCGGGRPGCFDLDRSDMTDAIEDFGDAARGADVALFFFAGHGMQTEEGNVIAPVNMELACDMLQARRGTMLDDVLDEMAGAKEKIVILDACRNDPFRAQQCAARGGRRLSFGSFAVPDSASRFLLMSSTQNGQVAQDGLPGGHSPFAESLIHWMEREPGARFDQLLDRVTKRVIERTSAASFTQIPEILIRGGAPEICLAPQGCAGAAGDGALTAEVERLKRENARNQEFEEIVVALLENAGYPDPRALSDDERRRFFDGMMEAARDLASRRDQGAQVALAALRSGDSGPAEDYFSQSATSELPASGETARQRARELRHLAALARPTDIVRAADYFERATQLDREHVQSWIDLAETSLEAGRRDRAIEAYVRASALAAEGGGTAEQRVWIAEGRADMEWAAGRTAEALSLYREANAAAIEASATEPDNTGLRRGVLVTHYNIGHLRMDAGDINGAKQAFQAGLDVAEALAADEPFDPRWQFDVGRGHERLGRALQQAGDLDGALAQYEKKHAIMEKVAAAFPREATWQRDLSLADEFLAGIASARGDHAAAARHYQASLERMIRVRDADPGNAGHQRFTSVTHLALGDAQSSLGEVDDAVSNYRAATAISERLVAMAPDNAQWRWDLFRAYQRLASSQPPGAEWHAKALETIEALAEDGMLAPANEKWIGITRERLEEAQEAEAASAQ